jgi:outer membrane receptor protein involved in Fe transport
VTALGFGPQLQEFTVSDSAPRATVAPIKLSRVAVALSGVAITAERATVEIEPDRNAYRAKDVAPAAANASEVLDAVPAVQVDGDGKVSFRGNENVAVQINGRPSPIRGAQLGAYLKTLPANIVEKVEVIPNPSAKYDPEGMAGIINIVLKQTVDLGLSGGLNAGAANRDRFNAAGNLGYQAGRLTTFFSVGLNGDDRVMRGVNDRQRHTAGGAPLSFTDQSFVGQNNNAFQNVTGTVDYKLSARDVLSTAATLGHRKGSDLSTMAFTEFDAAHAFLENYDRLRDAEMEGVMFDLSTAFKRTFDAKKKHELATELRFTLNDDEDRTALWRRAAGDVAGPRVEGETNETDALNRQLVAQLDYTRTFDKRRKLESGYRGNLRVLERDFLVRKDPLGTGDWTRSNLSNEFEFDENVQAVYGVFSQGLGKFDLQGGLRAEYASRDFALASTEERFPYDYVSLFPSAVAMYNRSDVTQMKASYSRRIRRPGTQELNPFPSFFDVQNVFIGNPTLNPEYTDAIELGLTRTGKFGSAQLSPFYRRTTDVIRVAINTADVVDGRDVTTVSFKNLATATSWGADMNGSLRLGKRLNAFGAFNVFRMVTDGGSQSTLSSDAVTWMTRVNATAQVTSTTTLQGSYFYRAPMKIERGRFSSTQMANFTVRQKINGEKTAVSLRVVDPFNTNRFLIKTGDANLSQTTGRKFGMRAVFLNYHYSFGRPPRVRVPRQDEQQGGVGFPSGG